MIRVGLVGEDPNDTLSIKHLLEKRYKDRVQFKPLAKGVKGTQLDTIKLKNSLRVDIDDEIQYVIFIRDLDAFKSQKKEFNDRIKWFQTIDNEVDNKGVLLLNIMTLEALILGDINTFNKLYKINHKSIQDPTLVPNPKKLLKQLTSDSKRPYKESHCPDIFKHLSIDEVEKNCSCFKDFIIEFDKRLNKNRY